jgi:hypothetical protein
MDMEQFRSERMNKENLILVGADGSGRKSFAVNNFGFEQRLPFGEGDSAISVRFQVGRPLHFYFLLLDH